MADSLAKVAGISDINNGALLGGYYEIVNAYKTTNKKLKLELMKRDMAGSVASSLASRL